MNGSSYNETDPFVLFGAGISASVSLFSIELGLFFWDAIKNVLPTIPASSPATTQVISYYSGIIGFFVILAIVQNAIVGFVFSKPFVLGYLLGVGLITYLLFITVINIIPSVIYGMAGSFAVALGSLIIRLYLEEHNRQRQWSNYP